MFYEKSGLNDGILHCKQVACHCHGNTGLFPENETGKNAGDSID
jgi:hypothetical protein